MDVDDFIKSKRPVKKSFVSDFDPEIRKMAIAGISVRVMAEYLLSRGFKVSYTAIWKYIKKQKKQGKWINNERIENGTSN